MLFPEARRAVAAAAAETPVWADGYDISASRALARAAAAAGPPGGGGAGGGGRGA